MKSVFATFCATAFMTAAGVPALSSAAEPSTAAAATAVGSPAVAATAIASTAAAASCNGPQSLTLAHRRILEKAAGGVDSLRQFITISRGVYGLDMVEAVAWLDEYRAAQAACATASLSAAR